MDQLVSVIVPIYNAAEYLDRCINSIVMQTYRKIELLLVDDGSTDQSAAMCTCWAKKDNRIRFYQQKNTGVSAARNLGLDHAAGQFITFVDADDYLKLNHIEKMLKAQAKISGEGGDIVVENAINIYADGRTETGEPDAQDCLLNQKEAVLHFLLEWPFKPVCWGRLYKRACIESVRFDETMRIAEDGKFFLDAIKNSHNVYFLSERSYFYFIREGSAVHSGFTEKYYDELRFCEDLVEQYRGKN